LLVFSFKKEGMTYFHLISLLSKLDLEFTLFRHPEPGPELDSGSSDFRVSKGIL
jgi:hypothetical protein